MIERVKMDDLHSAWMAWRSHHARYGFVPNSTDTRKGFSRFLHGAPLPVYFGAIGHWELTTAQADRMRLLLTPHARTIIKAYEATSHDV